MQLYGILTVHFQSLGKNSCTFRLSNIEIKMHYWGHGLGKYALSIYCCIGQGYHQHYREPKHGLRTPREFFFSKIPNFWAWADKLGPKFGGILGIFGQFISTHFGTVSPLSMFSINHPLFLQKTQPLYPNLKYLFGMYSDLNLGRTELGI